MANFSTTKPNLLGEIYTGATPLAELQNAGGQVLKWNVYDLKEMFIGTTPGTIGETSVIAILIGYLVGCFNLAFIISKVKKVDLQNTGSKNLGASNTFITVGKGLGVLVGACDIFKCTLVVLLIRLIFPEADFLPYIAGVACVMGHMFPFYLKFKGGKGFASFLGMSLGIHWKYFIVIMQSESTVVVVIRNRSFSVKPSVDLPA